jgi:LmbE family N-acetylglucosaminyl deacetylase
MVITPHPDDAEYGVAGTVARWVHEGKEVVYIVCTNGDKGTIDEGITPKKLAKIRENEQRKACKILGVKNIIFLRHPDQSLEDNNEFKKEIVLLIRKYTPDIVVTSDPYRRYFWHRDHRITGQVTLDAIFPCARDYLSYPDLIKKGLQPHKVKEVLLWGSEDNNYYSDITGTFHLKMAALRCHKSQIGSGKRTIQVEERMRAFHKHLAQEQNYELAETFHSAKAPE